ncbi:Modulator of FtsH protease HflC [Aquisphaera giovannonii]|uniref:Protein HflC n=1 Tax=Aquisphaera giovannonii TaxID=406548 RepID=A0A5B9WA35_9BACT|nr:protease modulator HflC [Aquisphaera giovannonii]QEH37432.1 Modulator of FtsH protease HflC [Aquisphaera giovannonii]
MSPRSNWRRALPSAGLAILATMALASACVVAVDESEFVLVTSFGDVAAVHDGGAGASGLHAKRPWQSALRVDGRLRVYDPPAREVMTGDKRSLDVACYVVYRVADPVRFLRGSGTLDHAEARLEERVSAVLSGAIGRRELADLAGVDSSRRGADAVAEEVLSAIAPAARADLGLEVTDLGLRRFNFPLEVRPAVFELIRSERRQVAARLRAEGEAQYTTITSRAERAREATIAQAEGEAERIRGRAEADATRILNEAHGRDPKFYELLRSLESYRALLDPRATVVLSANSPLVRLLVQGPEEASAPPDPSPDGRPRRATP